MTIDAVLEIVEPKKANHQANVVRIKTIYPHPDPETTNLELIEIDGYQVVVRKGEFQLGDLAVYIQPDSVVPQTEPFKFIWEEHVGLDGTVPAKRRRITVRKFRGEWSEGLLLPLSDFQPFPGERFLIVEGDDISEKIGVTHYDPDADSAGTKAPQTNAPKVKSKRPKTLKGWVRYIWYKVTGRGRKAEALLSVPFVVPTYDVDALKNYKSAFDGLDPNNPADFVVVTEKIHGSNARFLYLGGTMYAGSKNQWKAAGNNTWHEALKQNPWIEDWCRSNEGCALYGEVVPTQKSKNVTWDYGCKKGEVRFYAFDIYNTDGKWLNYEDFRESLSLTGTSEVVNQVPILYYGPYYKNVLDLANGPSWVFETKHIREGFVIKTAVERHVRGIGRLQLKVVSNEFLAKDSK